jgi:hypothetical protein
VAKRNESMMQVPAIGSGKTLPAHRASQNGEQHIEKWHAKNK